MSWSNSGNVASFPSYTPAYVGAQWTPGAPPMTFRVDPSSRIVYVTGSFVGSSTAAGDIATLPAAIRPVSDQFFLAFVATNTPPTAVQVRITASTGRLALATNYTGTVAVNGLYFLDL